MFASTGRLVTLLLLLSLTCSCRSVTERFTWKSIKIPIEALDEFEAGEFEHLATRPEIHRLASSRSVAVVWVENPSHYVYVMASRAPAGLTVSATLRALDERRFFFPAESEISRVVVIGPTGQRIADGMGALVGDAESGEGPPLQPGSVVFLDF